MRRLHALRCHSHADGELHFANYVDSIAWLQRGAGLDGATTKCQPSRPPRRSAFLQDRPRRGGGGVRRNRPLEPATLQPTGSPSRSRGLPRAGEWDSVRSSIWDEHELLPGGLEVASAQDVEAPFGFMKAARCAAGGGQDSGWMASPGDLRFVTEVSRSYNVRWDLGILRISGEVVREKPALEDRRRTKRARRGGDWNTGCAATRGMRCDGRGRSAMIDMGKLFHPAHVREVKSRDA